jgi:hypothetical protein
MGALNQLGKLKHLFLLANLAFLVLCSNADASSLDFGLVAYWDGCGRGFSSDEISGHKYKASLGESSYFSRVDPLNGCYIDSNNWNYWQQTGLFTAVWTAEDKGAFDAIGGNSRQWALSFWFKSNSQGDEDQLLNFVGSDNGDTTHDLIAMLGDYDGGTFFWRGYTDPRNNEDMRPYGDGLWHNMVMTQGGEDLYVYIDGAPISTYFPLTTSYLNISSGYNLTFGCRQTYADNFTQCGEADETFPHRTLVDALQLDEIAVWDRNFSQSEVSLLYNSGNGSFCTGYPCSFSGKGGALSFLTGMPVREVSKSHISTFFFGWLPLAALAFAFCITKKPLAKTASRKARKMVHKRKKGCA